GWCVRARSSGASSALRGASRTVPTIPGLVASLACARRAELARLGGAEGRGAAEQAPLHGVRVERFRQSRGSPQVRVALVAPGLLGSVVQKGEKQRSKLRSTGCESNGSDNPGARRKLGLRS